MSNTINENITKRILHEELMKLVCEEETPVATEEETVWILAPVAVGIRTEIALFHTNYDEHNIQQLQPVTVDYCFYIDRLILREGVHNIYSPQKNWKIIPENIVKSFWAEIEKYNVDTLKRKKISGILYTSLSNVTKPFVANQENKDYDEDEF